MSEDVTQSGVEKDDAESTRTLSHGIFPNTRKTMIERLRDGDTDAGNDFAKAYYTPILILLRALGEPQDRAQDIAQGFFEKRILSGPWLKSVNLRESSAKFRTMLKIAVKNYRADCYKAVNTGKRKPLGGTVELDEPLSGRSMNDTGIAISAAEKAAHAIWDQIKASGGATDSPDDIFDRAWAMAALDSALRRLRDEYVARRKPEYFDRLKQYLAWNSGEESYEELSRDLGITVMKVKMDVRALRKRFRDLLRDEVRQAGGPDSTSEIDDELRWIFRMVQGLPVEKQAGTPAD